jgi:hypothetical protein
MLPVILKVEIFGLLNVLEGHCVVYKLLRRLGKHLYLRISHCPLRRLAKPQSVSTSGTGISALEIDITCLWHLPETERGSGHPRKETSPSHQKEGTTCPFPHLAFFHHPLPTSPPSRDPPRACVVCTQGCSFAFKMLAQLNQ